MEIDWALTSFSQTSEESHECGRVGRGQRSTETVLWITDSDAGKYFNLNDKILRLQDVPKLQNSKAYTASWARYALHYVWDLSRVYFAREYADKVLKEFLDDKWRIAKEKLG
jgi:hypothetical protein